MQEQFLGYVQDERLIFAPCKIRISHIHGGRQDFVPDNPSPTNHFLKTSHV